MRKRISSISIIAIFALILVSSALAIGEIRQITRWTNLFDAPNGEPLAQASLAPDTEVTELNRMHDGQWVLVETELGNGWVPATALTADLDTPSEAPAPPSGNAQVTRWTNMYDSPGGSPIAGQPLAPDMIVTVVEYSENGHWAFVTTEIGDGWIPANAVSDSISAPASTTSTESVTNTVTVTATTPTITDVMIDDISSHSVMITLSYEGIPLDGYLPFFYIFDPDNCIVDCEDPDNALDYPINGALTILEGVTESGEVVVEVALDNLYCPAQPSTQRLVAVVADARPLNAGESTQADNLIDFPFAHSWCR